MKRIALLTVVGLLVFPRLVPAQTTITVGKSGGYDYSTIQAAIDAATTGDIVVVYPGFYPENIHFRGKSIFLRSSDVMNTATVAATIIDGRSSGTVVTFAGTETSSCVLSGFTIRNGKTTGQLYSDGSGIEGHGAHALIENNTISGNEAVMGGGIDDCQGTIQNNTIAGNTGYGGGLYGCHGLIQNNTIAGNTGEGGGLAYCGGLIQNNTISGNIAPVLADGGGLYRCNGQIRNNIITGNVAGPAGGGLVDCDGVIENNLIANNRCGVPGIGPTVDWGWGAGLMNCDGTIVNNTITSNSALVAGGGLLRCKGTIANCIVWRNAAPESPQIGDSTSPTYSCIQGWTFGGVGNISADPRFTTGPLGPYYLSQIAAGQAVQSPCVDAGSSTVLELALADRTTRTDGVFDTGIVDMGFHYGIAPPAVIATSPTAFVLSTTVGTQLATQTLEVWNAGGGTLVYSLAVSPGWLIATSQTTGQSSGGHNRHAFALHTAVPGPGTYRGEITITGNATNSPTTVGVEVTILQRAPRTLTVGKGGGYDFDMIQAAIDAAITSDTIVVAIATYFENINFKGKAIVLRSANPNSTTTVAATTIDGQTLGPVVTFAGTEPSSCVLAGFTIQNGYFGAYPFNGGGIRGNGTKARIAHNRIVFNQAANGGGLWKCNGVVEDNEITSNTADAGGGMSESQGIVQNNTFGHNRSSYFGAGLYAVEGIIRNNTIEDNWVVSGPLRTSNESVARDERLEAVAKQASAPSVGVGGGLAYCHGLIENNLIVANVCWADGAGGGLSHCSGVIRNNTITRNNNRGLFATTGTIVNCIVWNNMTQIEQCTTPTYSCIERWTAGGVGNIALDPLFVRGPCGEFYLSQTAAEQRDQSPCVDAGTGTALELGLAGLTTRTDGVGDLGSVDMGYHYTPSPPIPPTASTIPARFDYTILAGTDVGSKTLSVQNTGNGVLRFTIAASESWISIVPTSGTSRGEYSIHSATFATRDLAAGVHTANIVITVESPPGVVQLPVVITVLFPAGPNLTVSHGDIAPAAPAQVRPGSTITLGAFIENVGTSPARPFWTEVWGSRTGGLTLDRFLADSLRLPDGLPGNGASWSWITTAPLYSIPDGPYTVVYAVDRPGDVTEGNERDNRSVVRAKRLLVIRPPTQADLAVEGFGMSPNPATSGGAVAFAGRVVNRGAEACGPFWIEFWGSWDRPFPNLSFFLCDSIFVENLDAGASADLSAFPRRLYDVPTGIFMVGCVADRDDSINELNETNNYQFADGQAFNSASLIERAKRAASGGADISVTDADFSPAAPTQLAPGDTITLTVELSNSGSADTGPFWLEYWGSRDGGLTLSDFLTVSDRVTNLAAGARVRLSAAKPVWGIPDGPYSVVVFADRPGDVTEADRANNRAVVSGKRLLVIRPPTGANLELTSFSLSSGQWPDIGLGGAVRNAGTSYSGSFWIEFWVAPGDPDYPWLDRYARDSIHVDNLAPNEVLSLHSYPASFYSSLPAGEYVLIGFVDRLDQVIETDETDNYQLLRHFAVPAH